MISMQTTTLKKFWYMYTDLLNDVSVIQLSSFFNENGQLDKKAIISVFYLPSVITLMKIDIVLPYIILAMCIGKKFLPVCYSSLVLFDSKWHTCHLILGICLIVNNRPKNSKKLSYYRPVNFVFVF